MRISMFVVCMSLIVGGCTTMGPITAEESMVAFDLPAASMPQIDRTRRWDGQDLVEDWDWRRGQLYVVRVERRRYFTTNFQSPAELVEEAASWPSLERSGAQFNRRTVRTSENAIGRFSYGISDVDRRGDRCALLLQGLPASGGAGFEPIPTATSSQGYISMYECWSASEMSVEKLEQRILMLGEAMRFKFR